jgi:hypothetical protein
MTPLSPAGQRVFLQAVAQHAATEEPSRLPCGLLMDITWRSHLLTGLLDDHRIRAIQKEYSRRLDMYGVEEFDELVTAGD